MTLSGTRESEHPSQSTCVREHGDVMTMSASWIQSRAITHFGGLALGRLLEEFWVRGIHGSCPLSIVGEDLGEGRVHRDRVVVTACAVVEDRQGGGSTSEQTGRDREEVETVGRVCYNGRFYPWPRPSRSTATTTRSSGAESGLHSERSRGHIVSILPMLAF